MYLEAIGEALSYGTYLGDNDYWWTLATVLSPFLGILGDVVLNTKCYGFLFELLNFIPSHCIYDGPK